MPFKATVYRTLSVGQTVATQRHRAACAVITTCLQLYDLHSIEVLWEKAEDTKALLAWSAERIVLSFRGTASWANVLADLRFWLKGD
jgi:hypothetical protein